MEVRTEKVLYRAFAIGEKLGRRLGSELLPVGIHVFVNRTAV